MPEYLEQPKLELPKRKSRIGLFIILIIGFVIILAIIGNRSEQESPSTTVKPSVGNEQSYFAPGEEYFTESFAIRVPAWGNAVYLKSLGSDYSTKTVQDPGTYFCLIPLCVRNRSTATASLLTTWYLYTLSGLRFETASGADYYLDESERLDPIDIPPGITRCGKLVFLVNETARQAAYSVRLEFSSWGTKVRFRVPQI